MTEVQTRAGGAIRRLAFRMVAGAAAVVLAMFLWAVLAPANFWSVFTPDYGGGEMTVREVYQQAVAGDVILIDIRRPDEWRKTGIGEGAQPLDMRREDFVQALGALVDGRRDVPIALICARGVRSARLGQALAEAGFTRVINVPEGMLGSRAGPGWLDTGLPVRAWNADPA